MLQEKKKCNNYQIYLVNNSSKKTTLKSIFQNKGFKNKTINSFKDINNAYDYNKKILSLSKNKELLNDKRDYIFKKIFTPKSGVGDGLTNSVSNSINFKRNSIRSDMRGSFMKRFNGKKQLKDEFLLFAKARPYKYLTTSGN